MEIRGMDKIGAGKVRVRVLGMETAGTAAAGMGIIGRCQAFMETIGICQGFLGINLQALRGECQVFLIITFPATLG